MATILYDDDSANLLYSARTGFGVDTKYFGGSVTRVFLESSTDALSISFLGTSIMVYGALVQESGLSPEPLQVMIDNEIQPGVQFQIDDVEKLRVLYQSPTLSEETPHNLTIQGTTPPGSTRFGDSFHFDYAAVTAGMNTPLEGKRLIVDDHDPSVVYDGDWGPSTGFTLFDDSGPRFAYANTTHQTSSKGASATFSFNGTSAALFGASSKLSMDLEVEVDGESVPKSIMAFSNSTNYRWYQCSGLLPTNHTVKITYNGGDPNTTFSLDYLTYVPSFHSLAEKEGLPTNDQPTKSSRPSLGTLLGAIIGSVLFVIIIVVILLFMRKKKLGFWSSKQSDTGQNFSRLPGYAESVATPATSSNGVVRPLAVRLWQRRQPGTVEAFLPEYTPSSLSSSHQSLVQRKSILPVWNSRAYQRQASPQTDGGMVSENTADPGSEGLEQVIRALQQELEEARRERSGAWKDAPLRKPVGKRDDQENKSQK